MNGIELVTQEREEQITKHKFDITHDLIYKNEELIKAALYLLTGEEEFYPKSWVYKYYEKFRRKLENMDKREVFKVAAALIIAEIDRINAQENIDKPF